MQETLDELLKGMENMPAPSKRRPPAHRRKRS